MWVINDTLNMSKFIICNQNYELYYNKLIIYLQLALVIILRANITTKPKEYVMIKMYEGTVFWFKMNKTNILNLKLIINNIDNEEEQVTGNSNLNHCDR